MKMETFLRTVRVIQRKQRGIREGQAYMHALNEVDRHLYHEVVNTEIDPWHLDVRVPALVRRLEKEWK